MKVLVPGHRFELANLKSETSTVFQFYQDAELHGERIDGPNCQEVIRMLISRVNALDAEKQWPENSDIIQHGRAMIALFEARALRVRVEKGLEIEALPTGLDGHLLFDGLNSPKSDTPHD